MKAPRITHRDTIILSATQRDISLHVRKVESKKIYRRSALRQQIRSLND